MSEGGKRRVLGRGLAALLPGPAPTPPPAPAPAAVPAPAPAASGPATARPTASPGASAQAKTAAGPAPGPASRAATDGTVRASGAVAAETATAARAGSGQRLVAIEQVFPWRTQPRRVFDDERLAELAQSIRAQGVLQAILVRPREGGGLEIVDGERRWRAAQRAGLHEVPVLVRDIPAERILETALVANLQREDLNPIEQAEGYRRLIEDFGYTQEVLATRVGKDRTTITNVLRLLKLPNSVREMVMRGQLGMGHARALLGLERAADMEQLARRIGAQQLSVRQAEKLVQRAKLAGVEAGPAKPPAPSPGARDLGDRLTRKLGLRVRVVETGRGRGIVEMHYATLDQLDRLVDRLTS